MRVNGNDVILNTPMSLKDYLESSGYDLSVIAVEHNAAVIERGSYADIILHGDDTLEIVRFVGGG